MSFVAWMLVSVAGAVEPLPEQFEFQFSNGLENQPLLKLIGPNAQQTARTDAGGLRITLPAQRAEPSPVGVEPRFRLRGDFEVTLSYELLAAEPPLFPRGAGVVLWLQLDGSTPQTVTLTRVRKRNKDKSRVDMFGTNLITPGPDGKNKVKTQMAPASNTQGQLRLVRSGETLRFLASDGPNAAFRVIRALSIGTEDVKALQFQCATGGKQASLDARLIAVNIRASQLPNQPGKPMAEVSRNTKWLWLGVLSCLLLGVAGSFYWLVKRRGRRRPTASIGSSRKETVRSLPRP